MLGGGALEPVAAGLAGLAVGAGAAARDPTVCSTAQPMVAINPISPAIAPSGLAIVGIGAAIAPSGLAIVGIGAAIV
jgi:hypothetical protein